MKRYYLKAALALAVIPTVGMDVSAQETHDVFASPGWRTTGTSAANSFITPPGWSGNIPAGMSEIKAPTPYVWMIGRTKTDGPADYEAVHKIQAGYKACPAVALRQGGSRPEG